MKRSTFIGIGMVLTVFAILFASCGSHSQRRYEERKAKANANTMEVFENSSTKPVIVEALATVGSHTLYSVEYEDKTYLIAGRGTSVAIIEHTKVVKPKVAEPSKQSVATLDNPEVNPPKM